MDRNLRSILCEFDKFSDLLQKNKFYDETNFKNLTRNIEENDNNKKLEIIIGDIETRSIDEINRFADCLTKSGLVQEDPKDEEEDDESDDYSHVHELRLLSARMRDIVSSPKVCGEKLIVIKGEGIVRAENDEIYDMTANPRGICLIIDNQLFTDPKLSFRYGSRADAYRLEEVFSQLGFTVSLNRNQTVSQMKYLLSELSMNRDLKDHNALAVIILSHGMTDSIFGSDGQTIKTESVFSYFNNINCLAMINKPKIFFISACRGEQNDLGVEHFVFEAQGDDDFSEQINYLSGTKISIRKKQVPTWSDFFIFYSSVTGYTSLRNSKYGTWFGYELAHGLANYSHRLALYDLMTNKVGDAMQERLGQIDGKHFKQAIEAHTRGRTKNLYFNPGF